jgi:hypothetical protein
MSFLGVAALASLLTPKALAQAQLVPAVDQGMELRFSRPLKSEELSATINEMGIEPREMYYQSETMTAGYTLSPGESIEAAMAQMEQKQREFLEAAIEEVREARSVTRDGIELRGYSKLEGEFQASLKDLEAGAFGVRTVRLKDNAATSSLGKPGSVVESVGVPVGGRRRQENANQNPTGQARELWAPNKGAARVSRTLAFQTFYFSSVKGFTSTTSYSHRTEIWNPTFANYGYYWASNMPEAFLDMAFGLSVDVFGVGSTSPVSFQRNFEYFTHVALTGGGSSTVTPIVRIRGLLGKTADGCHGWASCVLNPLAITGDLAVFQAPILGLVNWTY